MKYTIKQLLQNKPRVWMVSVIVMLAYLVLAFIAGIFLDHAPPYWQTYLDLDFENKYEVKIQWKQSIINDNSRVMTLRKDLKRAIEKDPNILSTTYSNLPMIQTEMIYSGLFNNETILFPVEEDFIATLKLNLINGRDFIADDLIHSIPAVIIPHSLARKKGIVKTGNQEIIAFNRKTGKQKDQFDSIQFRVVGIVEDVMVYNRDRYPKAPDVVFAAINKFQENPFPFTSVSNSRDWIYIHAEENSNIWQIKEKLNQIIERPEFQDFIIEMDLQNEKGIITYQLRKLWQEFRPLLAIMILLIIYTTTTLFGIFQKLAQKKKEEYAIRRALGCYRNGIYAKIISEATLMTIPGMLVAGLLYGNFLFLQGQPELWQASIVPAIIILSVMIISIAWPAYRAGSIHPVDGLREV